MIALDTTVLVRFLVEDDAEQTERARVLLAGVVRRGESCFVSEIVLCELVWVLDSAYGFRRAEIVDKLELLLRARHLQFQAKDRIGRALVAFRTRKGDFSDYLVQEQARSFGCEAVATFDRALLSDEGFLQI